VGDIILNINQKEFIKNIKEKIHKSQYIALKSVHKELISLYWEIGNQLIILMKLR
jgi:hypothetical protein